MNSKDYNSTEEYLLALRNKDAQFTKKLHPEIKIVPDSLEQVREDMDKLKNMRFTYTGEQKIKMVGDGIAKPYGFRKNSYY